MDIENIHFNNIKQFQNYCNDLPQNKHPKFYRQLLIKLKNSISDGSDLKVFQRIAAFINVFTESMMNNKQNLKTWFMHHDNPIRSTNVIILCCKYNRKDYLDFILGKNEGVCLKNLSFDINIDFPSITDTDEHQHNAIYYAIGNGNVQMITMVCNHFFREGEESSNDQMEHLLASTYDELLLRNVKLSEAMILFIDKRLFQLRFSCGTTENKSRSNNYAAGGMDTENQLQLRINFVLETITAITSEYSDEQQFDQKLLILCRSLARNIHVLKLKLRATYSMIPWEEMEFIIVAFVLPHIQRSKMNIFYVTVLKENKFFCHLRTFERTLTENRLNLIKNNFNKYPVDDRYTLVEAMRKNDSAIDQLIQDFETMRDVYSFQKITEAVDLAISIDSTDPNRLIIISRLLANVGERLKNTWESPNLSSNASRVIFACMPKTIKENLEKFRNIISKNATIKHCSRVDTELIRTIQVDLMELKKIIDNIVNEKMTLLTYDYLNAICVAKTSDEIQKIFKMFDCVEWGFELYDRDRKHIQRLKTLVRELEATTKNASTSDLFDRLLKELDNPENLFTLSNDENQKCMRLMNHIREQTVVHKKDMEQLQYLIKNTLMSFEISKRQKNVNHLLELVKELSNSLLLGRTDVDNHDDDVLKITLRANKLKEIKINEMLKELLVLFQLDSPNLRWIEDLTFEFTSEIENLNIMDQENIVSELFRKLKELLKHSKAELDLDYWNMFKNNKKLQAAVEMIYIDIVSIADKFSFTYTNSYLDENCVFLMGKELRNHFAHHNTLLDILPINPTRCLLLNVIKLLNEFNAGTFNHPRITIGRKRCKEDLSQYRTTLNGQLSVIGHQNDLFVAQKLGQCDEIEKIIQNGADLKGRDIYQQNALHRAAMHANLDTIEKLVKIGLDLMDKDINGFTPLHVSVAHDNFTVTNYFLSTCKPDLKEIDNSNHLKLIYIAAESCSAPMIRLLLKYHTDARYPSLCIAIANRNTEAAKVFIENLDDVNAQVMLGNSPLFWCVEKDMLEVVKLLISRGADIHIQNDKSSTSLHAACLYGNYEMLKFLLENGADTDINCVNTDGATPLYMASRTGHYNIIQLLLRYGADPLIVHRRLHSSVLHRLCEYGHIDSVELILNIIPGDYMIKKDVNSRTPAVLAAENGHIEILQLLLQRINSSVDLKHFFEFPIFVALRKGHLNIVKLLVDQIFDINFNLDLLTDAAECGRMEIITFLLSKSNDWSENHLETIKEAIERTAINDHFNVLQLLLEKFGSPAMITNNVFKAAAKNIDILRIFKRHVDINTLDEDGSAVIHYAATYGNMEIINDLIASKANIRPTNTKKPLVLAAQSNFIDIIQALISVETPPDNELEDCLMEAIKWNNVTLVRYLQKQATLKKHQRFQCLKNAILLGHTKIVNLLLRDKYLPLTHRECSELLCLSVHFGSKVIGQSVLERGADIEYSLADNETPLFLCVANNDFGMTKFFIDKGAKVDIVTGAEGVTPTIICCKYGYADVLKLLLDHGANPIYENMRGETPIGLAVMHNNLECVEVLLATKKINVNGFVDPSRNTLLHIAAREGQLDITICLYENNADIHRFNSDGAKPIHLATKENRLEILEFYLNNKLNVNEGDRNQLSPLHYAALANKPEMIKFLLKAGANINIKNKHQLTPLEMAHEAQCLEAVEILLHSGAICTNRPKKNSSNEKCYQLIAGTQKLFECVKADDHIEIERLIKNGKAQVNANNVDNETILHQAAINGYLNCVKVALTHNGDPNVNGKNMFTPLHYAAKMNHFEIVKELLKHGAIYCSREAKGKTASQLTRDVKVKNLFRLISNAFADVERKRPEVIVSLSKIKDLDTFKVIWNARNERNETIFLAALKTSFPRCIDLQQLHQKVSGHELEKHNYNLSLAQRFTEAIAFIKQVKEDRKKLFGLDCPGNFKLDYMIAFQLHNLHKYDEALQLLNELDAKQKHLLDETCECMLETKSLMATILHGLARDKEALEIITSVISIEKNLPVVAENKQDRNHTLGLILQGLGRFKDAFDAFTKAFNIAKKLNALNTQCTLACENNIAQTLLQMRQVDEALKMFEDIRERRALHLGPHHSDTLRTSFYIIAAYEAKDDTKKVLDEYMCLFEKQRKALGASHFDTLRTQVEIGKVLMKSLRFHWALKYLEEALPGIIDKVGPNNAYVIQTMEFLDLVKTSIKSTGLNDAHQILQKCNSDLIDAVSSGDLSEMKVLLSAGADINTKDNAGFCPIHFAMRRNRKEVVELLLQKSADPMQLSNKGNTPLHIAASLGNHELADVLLKYIKENNFASFFEFINAQTKNGKATALHVTAKGGFVTMVKTLLTHGAMFDLTDANGLKPLDCCKDNVNAQEIVRILKACNDLFMEADSKGTEVLMSLTKMKEDNELFAIVTAVRNHRNKNLMGAAADNFKESAIKIREFKKNFIKMVQDNSKMLNN